MDAVELLDRCRFPEPVADRDERLELAVSGGPDSVAMALLAAATGRELRIWHVHHGLRPEADDDAELVARLAVDLGARFELRRVDLASGPGLEARARAARYAALPVDVCVGHTLDDRAETVLLNLFRGAGLAGVAAPMARVHRPLLGLRRHETVALCADAGRAVVDDPMNHDPVFSRVAVRTRVLPLVEELLGRDPVPLLARHADLSADALVVVRELAAAIDPTDVAALRAAPRAVASEALRAWLGAATGEGAAVDAASIERVLAVVDGVHVATEIAGGHRVSRSRGRLRVEPA
jgi:tRNA(Ile)-lysidine synthase